MNHDTDLDVRVKAAEASYIQLLHKTSIEIEKLKLIAHVLSCINQNEKFRPNIKQKIQELEVKLIDINNNKYDVPISEMVRFPYDVEEKCDSSQKLTIITEAKLSLIQSSSFEMDRLRTTIKYLTETGKILSNDPNQRLISNSEKTMNSSFRECVIVRTVYDWDEICKHCDEEDLWLVHEGKVYDITKFLKYHPGGSHRIIELASKNQDITVALKQLNHPLIYHSMLKKHHIGSVSDKKKGKHLANSSFSDIESMWDSQLTNKSCSMIKWREDDREPIIKWDDYFSVNIDILDKQQQHLISLINNLYFNYELNDMLELLYRWDVHCKTEETLFFYYNFDTESQIKHNADSKKIYHQIKDEITALRIKYDNSKPKCEELKHFALKAAQTLKMHHIRYDSEYEDELHSAMDNDDCCYGWINHSELKEIVVEEKKNKNYLIVDVRDRTMDYIGGSIINSINISHKVFCDQLPSFLSQYNNKPYIIMYCMYGAHRSKKCIRFYSKMVEEIINNYSKQTQSSFYQKYSDDMNIDNIEEIEKIKIKCNDEFISNIRKQKIFVLRNGFFEFINVLLENENDKKQISNILKDFNPLQWDQVKLAAIDNTKMWCHKNEYFAKT